MDYPFKGLVTGWDASNQHHHQHHHRQEIEVVVEDDAEQGNKSAVGVVEKEHMFDKVVTPSDVGKLNRLVIPKQHAEKYFPLDSSNNEKGLLLNFEDRGGKPWRFRYSYWNSSQSYVMTKGWSRFVKEKKLDAGDIVSFQRGVGEVGKDKLFIDWRRRPDGSGLHQHIQYHQHHHRTGLPAAAGVAAAGGWTSSSSPTFVLRSHPYTHPHPHPHPHPHHPFSQPYPYPHPQGGVGGGGWDHQCNTSPHLSTMSLMNVVPSQSHHPPLRRGTSIGIGSGGGGGNGSGQYTYGFGNVVNSYPMTGSLIFLRSPSSSSVSSTSSALAGSAMRSRELGVGQQQNVSLSLSTSLVEDHGGSSMMQREEEGGGVENMVYESVPVVQGKAAAKRLRLFGVNMDCPISHQTHDFDILSSSLASSSTPNYLHPHHHHQQQQQQHVTAISMGPPSSSSSPRPSQLRPFYNGTPPEKGKSFTSSSSMSLDLDI